MGDNQLSILIQAKINEASLDTMDKQLQTLAKNLKSVKISLDLGDVKAQFAKMFQEIEKESQKQKISSGVKVLNPSNQTFSGKYDEALKKAVVHVNALENHFERVGEIVKGLGNLKDLKEEFASADGSLVKMKAKVEKVDGTLKQIKDVEVFKTLNAETNEFVYTVGNATVQTKEFGYTVKQLQSASKNSGLYESMQKYNEGVIDAKQYTEELQKAIYRYGNESKGTKKFFGEMDEGIQKFYLEELAKAQEKVNQKLREEQQLAEEMNRKREQARIKNKEDFSNSEAIHKEKVKQWEAEQKSWEEYYKAKEKSQLKDKQSKTNQQLKENSDINKALLERLELQQKCLAMEQKIDEVRKASVSNISNAKSQYGGFIDESALRKIQLGFNELSVDTKEYTTDLKAVEAQIKALEKAYAKVEQEAKIAMEMDAQKRANNYAKEQENILNEQIKIEEDISKRRINLIDFEIEKQQEKARIFSQLLQAQMQGAVQAEQAEKKQEEQTNKTNKELTDRDTLCKRIQSQMSKLGSLDLVSSSEIAETQRLTKEYRELMTAIEKGSISLDVARSKFNNLGAQMRIFQQSTQTTTNTTRSLFDTFKTLVGVSSVFDVINLGKQAIRSMVSEVKTLDSALVELNKVSDLSDAQLNAYVKTAFKVSETVGRLGSDVINATSDFVQMGYSLEESAKLAENALMYVNVGDLSSVDEATSAMISAMKAFGIEANNSLDIVDKINNMSNNFAIDAKGIGEGLKRASSALASANNSIDETLALMSVGNQVIQDPDTLANGLKTISMRMRGLSEDGSELDSKIEKVFATYAKGVKVLNNDGSFRSTFAILNDLGKEWDKLSDKSQAYLAETIAGKDRANIFLSLMQNAEDLEKALETSKNSANSAVEENERYMNSIEGKISQMQTAWQSLASATINSDVVKGIIDITTWLIKLTETCGGLIPVVTGLAVAFGLLNAGLSFGVGGAVVAGFMALGAGIKYVATMSERAEERIAELKTSISDLTAEKRSVEQLAGTYNILSKKTELTEEEQAELTSTMNKLKTLIPNLNGYYKENGDFIVTNTEALKDYVETKREEIELNKEELAEKSTKTLSNLDASIKEQQQLIAGAKEYIALMDKEKDGTLSANEKQTFIQLRATYKDVETAQKEIELGTKSIAESLVQYREKLTDVLSASEEWKFLTDEQKEAMKEVIADGDYSFLKSIFDDAVNGTQDYINKLLQLEEVQDILNNKSKQTLKSLSDFGVVINDVETLKESFQKVTDGIGVLNSVLDDLKNGNGITAKSVEKIIEKYPQLLQYIHDEKALRTAIQSTMDEQKNKQQEIYNQMLASTDDYYQNVMLADDKWRTTTQNNLKKLFDDFKLMYEDDVKNYSDMEQAKAGITQTLINQLGDAWSSYFNQMSGAMAKGMTFEEWIATQGTYENMSIGQAQALQEEWQRIQAVQQGVASAFGGFEFKPVKLELGGSSKSASQGSNRNSSKPKASYIASIYQEMVNDVLKGSDDVEREIEKANAKIENALLRGNIDGKPDNYKELAKELKELSELGNVDLTIRPQIDSSKMQSAGWDVEDGSIATTFTQGEFIWQGDEENGSYKYIHYTPILPNGKVLSPDELSNYLSNTLESSEDILKADKLGIIIKVDDVDLPEQDIKNLFNGYDISSEMKNFLSQAGKWDDYIHQVQERFYKTKADSQEELADKVIELITQQRDNTAKMAKEIDALLNKMSKDLADTGLFKGYDLANLTEKQLAEVKQKLEKQINSATLQQNDKEVERLKLVKSLVEDVGSVYLSTLEKRKDLSQKWWDSENERIEKEKERIDSTYEKSKRMIDESNRDIELQQILFKEGTKEHIDCEKQKYNNLLALQEEARQALIKIKEHDKNLESKQAQEYLKIWYDTEKAKREKLISINKQIQDARKAELEKQMTAMKEYKDAMEKIIDATVKLIKQEQEAKKKALKDELDKYKSIINAKKEALKKEKDDKDYRTELSEKQAQITKVENKILELQNDNSLSAKKKRQELEEELLKLKKELTDTQEKHALDSALDTLDKEYEAFEKTQNDKIDAIDDYLDKEGKLRQDAIKRIEKDQEKLYKELLEWNKKYGTAIDSDITNAWDKAMKGIKEYGNGQNKVLTTIENIVEKLKEANEEIKLMKENSGVISGEDIADGNLYDSPNTNSGSQPTNKPQGEAYQKLIDEIAPQMNRNSDAWKDATSEEERKRLAQENERLAKKIGAWKKADGLWYVTKKGYDKPVALKELYPNYHTGGIVGGEAEAGLKSTEQFAKLLKGEVVSTESQMRQFLNVTYPKMLGITQGNSVGGITIDRFVDITVQGNLDTSVDLENIIKRASQKAIDSLVNTMSNMGIRGRII